MPATLPPRSPALLRHPLALYSAVLGLSSLLFLTQPARPQQASGPSSGPALTVPPRSWIADAAVNEVPIVSRHSMSLRYRSDRVDAKGDMVRDIIETPQGSVARLIERSGRPLTSDEDAAERARLTDILHSPADFARHHRHDAEDLKYTLDLIKQMPDAMLYSYTVDQPQLPGAAAAQGMQVVLDYRPNPAYHPPDTASELLTGIEGRIWVDARARRVLRIDARVVKPINLGWGILARVYPGGTIEFEQADTGNDLWVYSHMDMHVTVRELLVKTQITSITVTGSHFEKLPAPLSYQEAIQHLLDTPLATAPSKSGP